MRHALALLALCLLSAALWVLVLRLDGPSASPLPEDLPHAVRHPPPSRAAFPEPTLAPGPGDDIRVLHARGITGRHVGVAIVDRPLLTRHRDFADRLRWYDEIDTERDEPAGWHSTAVASIAVGSRAGAAPQADLYFVGVGLNWDREPVGNWWVAARRAIHSGNTLPLAIRRVLELNRRLPHDRRIRALSLSVGGGRPFEQAVDEARRAGLFVSAIDLHLPRLGPLTFASPAAPEAYTTHDVPAGSWAIARMAGRYALACEEDPTMTPERFMSQLGIRIVR